MTKKRTVNREEALELFEGLVKTCPTEIRMKGAIDVLAWCVNQMYMRGYSIIKEDLCAAHKYPKRREE